MIRNDYCNTCYRTYEAHRDPESGAITIQCRTCGAPPVTISQLELDIMPPATHDWVLAVLDRSERIAVMKY